MKLAEINEQTLSELELQINDAEWQKTQIVEYIGGLRAYYDGAKAYLEMKSKLKGDGDPPAEIKDYLAKVHSNSFLPASKNPLPETGKHARNQSLSDSDIPTDSTGESTEPRIQQIPTEMIETTEINPMPADRSEFLNRTASAAEKINSKKETKVEISDEDFRKLSQFEAIKTIFIMAGRKIPKDQIKIELFRRGWKPESEFFDQSLNSMLRYYEKMGVFERDEKKRWGLITGEVVKRKKYPAENEMTNSDCSFEILKNCGQPSLHVNDILLTMKQRYGYIRDKESVASTLRKAAVRNKRFTALGGNRFGLIQPLPQPAAKEASA